MWSDCAPPSTAESAWSAVRTTLFIGWARVRVAAAVWQWKRSRMDSGFRRAEALLHDARVDAPRRAELRDLLEEVVLRHEVEGEARRELVHRDAGARDLLDVGDGVGHGEARLPGPTSPPPRRCDSR